MHLQNEECNSLNSDNDSDNYDDNNLLYFIFFPFFAYVTKLMCTLEPQSTYKCSLKCRHEC